MEVNVYKIVGTDTLRHRETARTILDTIENAPENTPITIDFTGVTFTSRSFLHELLSGLTNRKYTLKNTNEEIKAIAMIAFNKPQLKLQTSEQIKELVTA